MIGAIFGLGSISHAATASWSTSAPSVNGEDIASFNGTNNDGGNIAGGNDDGTFLTSDRPGQGQEFTTGSDTNGYYLNAVTLQHVSYNSPMSMDSGWPGFDGSHFEIKVGTISGSSFSAEAVEVTADLAGDDPASPGYQNNSGPDGSYLTLTFDDPIYLNPDTTYAFTVWLNGGAYMEINGNSSSSYSGGEAFSESGGAVTARTGDRVFHVDMVVSPDGPPPPPEPAVFDQFPTTEPLQTVDLSGTWSFTPDQGGPTTIQVPGGGWFKQGFTSVDEADYETTINVPDSGQPQTTVLEFGAVNYEARLYVDEVFVGTKVQAYTPASWDISDYVTPGSSHDIRVHVLSMGARMVGQRSLDPNGAGSWCDALPQGIFRSAELKIYPEVFIEDVFVRTYVSSTDLYYDVWLRNDSASAKTVSLSGDLTSWNGDAWNYPSLPSQQVNLPADSETKVTVGPVNWNLGSDSYWWPNVPYEQGYTAQLHNLDLSISGDGSHSTSVRFGFRECTQEPDGLGNTCYFLNGTRVNFRGDSFQGANYDGIDYNGRGNAFDTYPGFLPGPNGWPKAVDNFQRLNYNFVRIHQIPASPYMLDVCDEMGLMICDETGIRGSGDQQDFTAGHDNMVNHVKALFARDRNHASIMKLSVANEPDWSGSAGGTAGAVQFIEDLYAAAMEVDGTRPISIDTGAGDYNEITHANFAVFPHYGASHSEWGNYTDEVYARPDRPYGCGEFIWDSDNTKPGWTWFGTATAAMRAKGASDTRPYTLLSAWGSVIPGTSTTDMPLENPPWDSSLYLPLYGEDNLPDPWINYQFQRVQAGFHPNLVADADYWELNKTSNGNGDWPAVYETLAPNSQVTRTLNIFNDTFSDGTAIDVYWELHQDSATGTLLDSGVVNASVPYGYVANEDIIFDTPNAPDGTLLNLVLVAEKNGVEVFREEKQTFVIYSGSSYPLTNAGFEQPAYNGKLANGFDEQGSDPNGSYEVPGWSDIGAVSDSGIEFPGSGHSGSYAAYMKGQYEPSPFDGMYNMTGYTIQSGDSATVTFWAKIDAADDPGWIDVTCRTFGGSNPNLRLINETRFGQFEGGSGTPLTGGWRYCEVPLSSADLSAQVGQELGVAFFNSQYFWSMVDDVKLYVNTTPPDFIPPQTPSGLTVDAGPGIVSLDWDNNTDSDFAGFNVYRSTTSGGPYSLVASLISSSNYDDSNVSNGTTYYYVVSAVDDSGYESKAGEVSATPASIGNPGENFASSESTVSGSVSGNYTATYYSDDSYESITETESGGKPTDRYSYLEHTWAINIGSGGSPVLYVEAHHTANSEGDDFVFGYSTDNNNFTDVLTVTKTSDNNTAQSVALPGGLSGTVYIRVVDTDQSQGNRNLDTVYVDKLYIDASGGGGPVNNDPSFNSDPVVEADATEGAAYSSTLADDASDPDSDPLNFTNVGGPAWLNIANDGVLSGTPGSADIGLNSWMVDVDDGQGGSDTATLEITVNPAGPAADIYISDIAMSFGSYNGNRYSGIATITVRNDSGAVVPNATVSVDWSGDYSNSDSGTTDGSGVVVFESQPQKNGGTFTITVTDVTASGANYNAGLNVETSDTVTAP